MATFSTHGHLAAVPLPSTPASFGGVAAASSWRKALRHERWTLTAAVLSGTALAVATDLWILTHVTILS